MRFASLVLVFLTLVLAGPLVAGEQDRVPILPNGQDLVSNPDFERGENKQPTGWRIGYQRRGGVLAAWGNYGIGGGKGIRFTWHPPVPTELKPKSAGVSRAIQGFKPGETIEVTGWLKLDSFKGTLVVWARCDSAEGVQRYDGSFQNSDLAGYTLEGSTIWSPVTVRVTPNEKTKHVMVGLFVAGRGTVDLHSLHARVRATPGSPTAARKSSLGSGLYRAEGRYTAMSAKAGGAVRVHLPVPILWRDQIPLDFKVWSEPEGHVESVRLFRTELGFHMAEVKIKDLPAGQKQVAIHWAGHVLVLPHRASPVPKGVAVPVEKVPEDVKPWLASTWCCDLDDPALKMVAGEIAAAGKTADVIVPATLARMQRIFRSAEGRTSNLTASEALTKRGSCTSCANLGAALLRANGIPARIIAGYPTWSGPLQTHYVVEYWLPKGGWRVMESTMCKDDRPGWEQIEVAMVRPEDEAEDVAGRRFSVAGGVPYGTLTEYPDMVGKKMGFVRLIGDMPDKYGCDHQAVAVAVFPPADDKAWAIAAKTLADRWRSLTAAAVNDVKAVPGLAPRAGVEKATSLPELIELLR